MNERGSRDTVDRRVGDVLREEAVGRAPDRILEGVFGQTQSMPQARRWPWYRLDDRRRPWQAGMALLAAALLAIAVGMLGTGGGARLGLGPGPATQRPNPIPSATAVVCGGGSGFAVSGGTAWVACRSGLQRIELGSIPLAHPIIAGLGLPVSGGAGLFATTADGIAELDAKGAVTRTIPGSKVALLAVGRTALWATRSDRNLQAIDPSDGGALASITLPATPLAILGIDDDIWVAGDDGRLRHYDGRTLVLIADFAAGSRPARLAASTKAIYAISLGADALLTRVDLATGARTSAFAGDPQDPRAIDLLATSDDIVWINHRDHLVTIDPTTLAVVRDTALPAYPGGFAIVGRQGWVYAGAGRIDEMDVP
jgi:hypothetical protein